MMIRLKRVVLYIPVLAITLSYILYGVNLAHQIQNISTNRVETLKSL